MAAGGGPKSPNNVTSTFFHTVHLLPKELRFEDGGAKLAFCHGRQICLSNLVPPLSLTVYFVFLV